MAMGFQYFIAQVYMDCNTGILTYWWHKSHRSYVSLDFMPTDFLARNFLVNTSHLFYKDLSEIAAIRFIP